MNFHKVPFEAMDSLQKRVLIIEDDLTAISLWKELLSGVGEKVLIEWASCEEDARFMLWNSILEDRKYDLVITDIYLSSHRTGLDLWKSFHEEFQGKFIVVSGIDYQKLLKTLGPGLDRPFFLHKPFQFEETISLVRSVMGLSHFHYENEKRIV